MNKTKLKQQKNKLRATKSDDIKSLKRNIALVCLSYDYGPNVAISGTVNFLLDTIASLHGDKKSEKLADILEKFFDGLVLDKEKK